MLDAMRPNCILLCIALTFAGCSGSEEEAQDETSPALSAAPDQRFASAESLVMHAQSLLSGAAPRLAEFYGLFYWETPDQHIWERYLNETAIPSELLNQEVEVRFGKGSAFAKPGANARAKINDTAVAGANTARATGSWTDGFNKRRTLHLVKVSDRWWISGNSSEATGKDILARYPGKTIEFMRGFNEYAAAKNQPQAMASVLQKLRNGGFTSLQGVKDALLEARASD